jgi:acetolactate synthase-1/3 small subunit
VHAPSARRAEIVAMASVFGARTLDVGASSMVLEMTGAPDKVQSFIDVIRPFGLKEMMRTGRVAMARAAKGGARAHRAAPALVAAS